MQHIHQTSIQYAINKKTNDKPINITSVKICVKSIEIVRQMSHHPLKPMQFVVVRNGHILLVVVGILLHNALCPTIKGSKPKKNNNNKKQKNKIII